MTIKFVEMCLLVRGVHCRYLSDMEWKRSTHVQGYVSVHTQFECNAADTWFPRGSKQKRRRHLRLRKLTSFQTFSGWLKIEHHIECLSLHRVIFQKNRPKKRMEQEQKRTVESFEIPIPIDRKSLNQNTRSSISPIEMESLGGETKNGGMKYRQNNFSCNTLQLTRSYSSLDRIAVSTVASHATELGSIPSLGNLGYFCHHLKDFALSLTEPKLHFISLRKTDTKNWHKTCPFLEWKNLSTARIELAFSRPQRDVLTTGRCRPTTIKF